jgi:hypothetical protein
MLASTTESSHRPPTAISTDASHRYSRIWVRCRAVLGGLINEYEGARNDSSGSDIRRTDLAADSRTVQFGCGDPDLPAPESGAGRCGVSRHWLTGWSRSWISAGGWVASMAVNGSRIL